jgi:hypothetical protein
MLLEFKGKQGIDDMQLQTLKMNWDFKRSISAFNSFCIAICLASDSSLASLSFATCVAWS